MSSATLTSGRYIISDLLLCSLSHLIESTQIRGRKTWLINPPPDCEHVCRRHSVTVESGDVIIIDTNIWYHETFVHEGDMSITIGAEYD